MMQTEKIYENMQLQAAPVRNSAPIATDMKLCSHWTLALHLCWLDHWMVWPLFHVHKQLKVLWNKQSTAMWLSQNSLKCRENLQQISSSYFQDSHFLPSLLFFLWHAHACTHTQAITKQFAEILHFTLSFDDLKVRDHVIHSSNESSCDPFLKWEIMWSTLEIRDHMIHSWKNTFCSGLYE